MEMVIENDILEKIKMARLLINSYSNKFDNTKLIKLKETVNLAESAYNEVMVNRIKSDVAMITMKEIEFDLDAILREVKN